jgi:hypothetical protein
LLLKNLVAAYLQLGGNPEELLREPAPEPMEPWDVFFARMQRVRKGLAVDGGNFSKGEK